MPHSHQRKARGLAEAEEFLRSIEQHWIKQNESSAKELNLKCQAFGDDLVEVLNRHRFPFGIACCNLLEVIAASLAKYDEPNLIEGAALMGKVLLWLALRQKQVGLENVTHH